MRGANAKEHNYFSIAMAGIRSCDPVSAAVFTTQESVKSESRHTLSVLQSNDDRSSLAATTHDRPLGGFIGELYAKSIREAQRFVDERLAITCKVCDAIVSAQDRTSKNNMETKVVAKIMYTLE